MGDVYFKTLPSGPELTDEQRRSAALYVCSKAADNTDALELLQTLGLTDV